MTNVQIFGLPRYITEKYITEKYMFLLDVEDLKSLYNANRDFREFCQRTLIWKKRFETDFPLNRDEIPEYVKEVDWMRVYYWFRFKNRLKKRLGWGVDDEINIPSSKDGGHLVFVGNEHDANKFLSLGGQRMINSCDRLDDYIEVCGTYGKKYHYTITYWFRDSMISVRTLLSSDDKPFFKFIQDLRIFLISEPPNLS